MRFFSKSFIYFEGKILHYLLTLLYKFSSMLTYYITDQYIPTTLHYSTIIQTSKCSHLSTQIIDIIKQVTYFLK